ncbi:MAG: NUDIX hydrolase [Planctomycetota bacterium]|jgi:8-oxo-dGTP diphosphatase
MTLTRVAVRVDLVVFSIREEELQVLLWRREEKPFLGYWAVPGGFVRPRESLEKAAPRILAEKTGLDDVYLEQLYTFGDPGSDPRGAFVSVAYYAVVPPSRQPVDTSFHPARRPLRLAFHHQEVLTTGVDRLRTKTEYSTVPLRFLEEPFTLSEVQAVYEVLLERPLDKRNFRRKMLALKALEETPQKRRRGAHRPARLFRCSPSRPYLLKDKGILFPF